MKRIMFLAVVAVLAITGGAYAAGSITGQSIKDKSITGKDIKPKSLTSKHFKGSVRGPRGASGPAGPAGAPGPAGPPGMGNLTVAESAHVSVPPGGSTPSDWRANCPAGTRVVGTGIYDSIGDPGFVKGYGTFVGGIVFNNSSITISDLHLQAFCVAVSGAVASSAGNVAGRRAFAADYRRALK